jgi:hypothetical protein
MTPDIWAADAATGALVVNCPLGLILNPYVIAPTAWKEWFFSSV